MQSGAIPLEPGVKDELAENPRAVRPRTQCLCSAKGWLLGQGLSRPDDSLRLFTSRAARIALTRAEVSDVAIPLATTRPSTLTSQVQPESFRTALTL
jgi:hypothetical protein